MARFLFETNPVVDPFWGSTDPVGALGFKRKGARRSGVESVHTSARA